MWSTTESCNRIQKTHLSEDGFITLKVISAPYDGPQIRLRNVFIWHLIELMIGYDKIVQSLIQHFKMHHKTDKWYYSTAYVTENTTVGIWVQIWVHP